MKAKIKLTPDQFCFLVQIVEYSINEIDYRHKPMEFLNINSFLKYAQKKVIDIKSVYKMIMPPKPKSFSIDVNQLIAVLYMFKELEYKDEIDSYGIALYETLKEQSRPMILN